MSSNLLEDGKILTVVNLPRRIQINTIVYSRIYFSIVSNRERDSCNKPVPRKKLLATHNKKAKEFQRKDAENVPSNKYKGTMERRKDD